MFKTIVVCTKDFETVEAAEEFFEEAKGELKNHPDVKISGRVVTMLKEYPPDELV